MGTIVVRSGSMRRRAPQPHWGRVGGVVDGSPAPVDGEAHYSDGPVMVNWTAARREAANPRLGRDVVLHEFAHKLDMLDGTVDGTPPIADGDARQRWIDVCTAEYEAVRRGEPGLLAPTPATNPGEFFAVATEAFFTRPLHMEEDKPELYGVLAAFYHQHPAEPSPPRHGDVSGERPEGSPLTAGRSQEPPGSRVTSIGSNSAPLTSTLSPSRACAWPMMSLVKAPSVGGAVSTVAPSRFGVFWAISTVRSHAA